MEQWVAALTRAESYPDERAPLTHLQTHISHVFLGAERVYKLRKPVHFGFVDFSSRALRAADCAREVELNRRLAPSVYLGVARIEREGDRVRVGPTEQTPDDRSEWLVVMRRLPEGGDLQSRLEADLLEPEELGDVAAQLADFHRTHRLGPSDRPTADAWLGSITDPIRSSCEELVASPFAGAVDALRERFEARAQALASCFVDRRRAGRAVEGHGDLRLEHLWRDDAHRVQVIDCVEFDEGLRRIDAASDLAFLSMDLRHRGRPDLAEHLLARYAACADDWGLYQGVGFFEAYRALVRAKVAWLRARDADLPAASRRGSEAGIAAHLDLAAEVLEAAPARAAVLVCGTIGTGKSTAARALCDRIAAVHLAADRIRPHVVETRADDAWGGGGYDDAAKDAVYRGLLERAEPVRASGRVVVLDATWSKARWRREAAAWARAHDLDAWLVETDCDRDLVRERVAARQRAGGDPSQAGPELVDASRAEWEPPVEWPERRRVRVDMGASDWREHVDALARRVPT